MLALVFLLWVSLPLPPLLLLPLPPLLLILLPPLLLLLLVLEAQRELWMWFRGLPRLA